MSFGIGFLYLVEALELFLGAAALEAHDFTAGEGL